MKVKVVCKKNGQGLGYAQIWMKKSVKLHQMMWALSTLYFSSVSHMRFAQTRQKPHLPSTSPHFTRILSVDNKDMARIPPKLK